MRRSFTRPGGGVCAAALLLLSALALLPAPPAGAAPFHRPVLDAVIHGDGDDWARDDHVVRDFDDDNALRPLNTRDLWLTWDADSLYVGLYYQTAPGTMVMLLDAGLGIGPDDASLVGDLALPLRLPAGRSIDFVAVSAHTGPTTTALPVFSRVAADGSLTDLTARTRAVNKFAIDASFPDKSPFWFVTEMAVPWSALYPDGVPAGAVLRAAVAVRSNTAGSPAVDVMPGQGVLPSEGTAMLTTMSASPLDPDGDGLVDPLDAGVAGTVTLANDPGGVAVTVTAVPAVDPWGLTHPLASFFGASGERDYRVGRLPADEFDLTFRAPGYLPLTRRVSVAAGQELTGVDVTLAEATVISGTLSLELGQASGGFQVTDPDGEVLASRTLIPAQFPFAFSFPTGVSGVHTLTAYAENHLTTAFPIDVLQGEDQAGLAFTLPRAPRLSGSVLFSSGTGAATTVSLTNAAGDTVFATRTMQPGAPDFTFYAPRLGALGLRAAAPTYGPATRGFTAAAGEDLAGLDLTLQRLPELDLTVAFADGPGHAGELFLARADGSAPPDTLAFTAAGLDLRPGGTGAPLYLAEGAYELTLDAPGYRLRAETVTLGGPDSVTDAGLLTLEAVRATDLQLIGNDGAPLESLAGTVSIPADDFYSFAEIRLEAVDADGRRDLFDLDGKLTGLTLTARKPNDVIRPSGNVAFLGSPTLGDGIATAEFRDGLCTFWMIDDVVEVLRVWVGDDVPEAQDKAELLPYRRFLVGFRPPEPAAVVLSAYRAYPDTPDSTFTADGADRLVVAAKLYDSAGNENRTAGVTVTFSLGADSPGRGAFSPAVVLTSEAGVALTELTATGAGQLLIDAVAVHGNEQLATLVGTPDGEAAPLIATATAGATAAWRFALGGNAASIHEPFPVDVQLVDALGNPTAVAGVEVQLAAAPAALGALADASPATDANGVASTVFTPAGATGFLGLNAAGGGLDGDAALIQMRDVAVVRDPVWTLEDPAHNSFDTVDLTSVVVDNTPDALLLDIPFASAWGGLQFHVIFETKGDAAGGSADSFEQPVSYGHALKPDYVLNLKYDRSYGDLRQWGSPGGGWTNWWDDEAGGWITAYAAGVEIQNTWADFRADGLRLTVPWEPFGGVPDSLRFEVYVTQVDGETKRGAFDSVPEDATLDLDFDYLDPGPGDWESTTNPVILSRWSPVYVPRRDFPARPLVTDAAVEPAAAAPGSPVTLRARVTDAGGGVGAVVADLSALGGGALTPMYDDGLASHGDQQAGDGLWSLRTAIPLDAPGGAQALTIAAFDADDIWATEAEATLTVEAQVELIVSAVDALGDDHGPNRPGVQGLYYEYPTNAVFVDGAFDLEKLEVYETTAVVNGTPVEMVAFAVTMGDLPDPADPFTADWNPSYGELNIQKIDILIDSGPGGATLTLPNRGLDVQKWNAWDYAVIVDGWYKAVIPSRGVNSLDAWRTNALRTERDIQILGDFDTDVVTALVSKAALGDPTPEEIASWGIAVLMSSHDFGGEEVLGGIRWVNETLAEWQFSGGSYTALDPNVMDLLVVPGAGREPGRPQEEILDYESPAALARLDAGRTPCALEMSRHVDTDPPAILIDRDRGELVVRRPLVDAPVNFAVEIRDDTEVAWATFYYRASGAGAAWTDSVAMGRAEGDVWTVDIPADWIADSLVASPIDGARYLEFRITASDVGNLADAVPVPNVGSSAVMTMQLDPSVASLRVEAALADETLALRHVDGSVVQIGAELRGRLLAAAAREYPGDADADSLAGLAMLGWDIAQPPSSHLAAPVAPRGLSLGVAREVRFDVSVADGSRWTLPVGEPFDAPYELTLHYTAADLPSRRDEQKVAVYEYHPASDTWVLLGGHVNPDANQVTVSTDHAGVYGLFWTESLTYDTDEVVSGITLSPNPFSPNDDGLYDQATLSYYLAPSVTGVTVEVYDIDGRFQRRLSQTFFGGETDADAPRRISGLAWDGRDEDGDPVPYGIYILRLIVEYKLGNGSRTIRSNHPVAVIR